MLKRVLASVLTVLMLLTVIPAASISAATLPLYSQNLTYEYYMNDNNGVTWYLVFNNWYFKYGVSISDSTTDYLKLQSGISLPTSGTVYVADTKTPQALFQYSEAGGWQYKYSIGTSAGGSTILPGMGTTDSYIMIDNNSCYWRSTMGSWQYMKDNFWTTGTLDDYLADNDNKYPTSGTVFSSDGKTLIGYSTFNEETKKWSAVSTGGNMGGIVDSTIASYTITAWSTGPATPVCGFARCMSTISL